MIQVLRESEREWGGGESERYSGLVQPFKAEEVVAGTEIPGGGGRGRLYLTLHCHRHNDSCNKMGSDESDFNVSLIVRDKVTKRCPQTTNFEERRTEAELKSDPIAY